MKIRTNIQKYAVTRIYMHLYALNMQKYARYVSMKGICKICKNMHSLLCSWSGPGCCRTLACCSKLPSKFMALPGNFQVYRLA